MRSASFYTIGLVVGSLIFGASLPAATSAVAPEADAYVRGGPANEGLNFGADPNLVVKDASNAAYKRVSYLRFQLALPGQLSRAVLKLNCTALTQGTGTIEAFIVDDDSWDESAITWVSQPVQGARMGGTSVSATGAVEIELTAYAQQQQAGDGVLSVALVQPENQNRYIVLAGREATEGQPSLEITVPDEADTAGLSSEADTYVRGGAGNEITNFGSEQTLMVKDVSNSSYKRRTYLRFSLPAANQAYSQATLRLNCVNLPQGPAPIEVWSVADDSWSETGITWLDQPDRQEAIASTTVNALGQMVEIDVTSYVQYEQGNDGVVSLCLVQPNNANALIEFASREAGMGCPTLGLKLPAQPGCIPKKWSYCGPLKAFSFLEL